MGLTACSVKGLTEAGIDAALTHALTQAVAQWIEPIAQLDLTDYTMRVRIASILYKELELGIERFQNHGRSPAVRLRVDDAQARDAVLETWGSCHVGTGPTAPYQFVLFSQPADPTDQTAQGNIRYFLVIRSAHSGRLGLWQPAHITADDPPRMMVWVGTPNDNPPWICRAICRDLTNIQLRVL